MLQTSNLLSTFQLQIASRCIWVKSAFNILENSNFIWMPFQVEKCTLVGNMLLRIEGNICIIKQEEYAAVSCLRINGVTNRLEPNLDSLNDIWKESVILIWKPWKSHWMHAILALNQMQRLCNYCKDLFVKEAFLCQDPWQGASLPPPSCMYLCN